jgi:hypothetical protein
MKLVALLALLSLAACTGDKSECESGDSGCDTAAE